jgi:hypothetical protein
VGPNLSDLDTHAEPLDAEGAKYVYGYLKRHNKSEQREEAEGGHGCDSEVLSAPDGCKVERVALNHCLRRRACQ